MTMIDPETVDWTEADDSKVWSACRGGIPQAVDEARRRGIMAPDEPAPHYGPLYPYSGIHG